MEAKHVQTALAVLLLGMLFCAWSALVFVAGMTAVRYLPREAVYCCNGLTRVAAPPGTPVTIEDEGLTATLTDVARPADRAVAEGSSLNPTPAPGQEFVRVRFSAACDEGNDEPCSFNSLSLLLVGTRGVYGPQIFIIGVEGDGELLEIPPGQEASGAFYFLVPQEDEELVLVYRPIFGEAAAYFSLGR